MRTFSDDDFISKNLQHCEEYEIKIQGMYLKVSPNVFSPIYSYSSQLLCESIPRLDNARVLDVGAGCGIQAIMAARQGATKVVAVDISPFAVRNVLENVNTMNLKHKIDIRNGNLFCPIKKGEQFDCIIANLPFVPKEPKNLFEFSVYDYKSCLLKCFFKQCHKYMTPKGTIIFAYSSIGNIQLLNRLIKESGLLVLKERKEKFSSEWWMIYTLGGNYFKNA